MQINRKQLRYIYNRFGFTRPSLAFYPENSATPGKCATYGEARVGIMTSGAAGVMVEPGTSNLIPLNRQKFERWTAHGGAVVTLTQGIAVPEWGAVDATRIQTSGGTGVIKCAETFGRPQAVAIQIYIKNIGTTTVQIYPNMGGMVDILPGESRLVKLENLGNGVTLLWIQFRALDVADSLDFIAWRPQAEPKPFCTSWTDGTRAPETLSVPGLPTVEGEIEFTAEITDKCKRQVAGETPALIIMARADGGTGLQLMHADNAATYELATFDDTEATTAVTFADSLIPNGTRTLKISITTSAVILYCDGVEIARIDNPKLPSAWGRIWLGSSADRANHADAMFGGIKMMAADSTVLSDILFNGPDFIRKARTIQL